MINGDIIFTLIFRFLPFFSAKAMASSLEEKESSMLDKGSALKGKKKQNSYIIEVKYN